MRSKFGHVEDLNDSNFRARVSVDGKIHQRHFSTKESAQDWLEELRLQLKGDTFELARNAESTTLREAIAKCRAEHKTMGNGSGQAKKLAQVERHGTFLLDMGLAEIRLHHIIGYRNKRAAMDCQQKVRLNDDELPPRTATKVSPQTIDKEISALSVVFEYARKKMLCPTLENPTVGARYNTPTVNAGQRITDDMLTSLINAAAAYEAHEQSKVPIAAFIQLALLTTCRLSKLAGARWKDIAPNGKTIFVGTYKNGELYSIPLLAASRAIIEKLPRVNQYIFGCSRGGIVNAWKKIAKRSGIDVRIHDLRHEGITRLVENAHELGLTDIEIMQISGHKSYAAFKRYVHSKQNQIVDKIDRAGGTDLDQFIEDLLLDTDETSRDLAAQIMRKRREYAATRANGRSFNVIEGAFKKKPDSLDVAAPH